MTLLHKIAVAATITLISGPVAIADDHKVGYTDTPYLPDSPWRVHDAERSPPAIMTPNAGVFVPPPPDAIVLFDGNDLSEWRGRGGGDPVWIVEDGTMRPAPRNIEEHGNSLTTRRHFGDIQLHVEWRTPGKITGESQGRGNSGIILMGRYEVQVLDSYDNVTYADGQAGAIYGFKPPLVNASLPPGMWQSYDIVFEVPHFGDDGELISPAYVTVMHNGILIHHRQAYPGATAHRSLPFYKAHAPKQPLTLQDHNDPVRYRNIWIRELDLSATD